MSILIEKKRDRILFYVMCVVVIAVLTGVFLVRYRMVNYNSRYQFVQDTCLYGEEYHDGDISYRVDQPDVSKQYSSEYDMDIYHYVFPLHVENGSKEELYIFDLVPNFCIFSGGETWFGSVEEAEKAYIKPETETDFTFTIDVIPNEELDDKIYDRYEFYNSYSKGGVTYKIKYE